MASFSVKIIMSLFVLSITSAFPSRLLRTPSNPTDLITTSSTRQSAASKLSASLSIRGGSVLASSFPQVHQHLMKSPTNLFNCLFLGLAATAIVWKGGEYVQSSSKYNDKKPSEVKSLQWRFLVVFWLIRMADWLQGPYFYEVYSSKVINGTPVTLDLVSKLFLVGFASTGLFGPWLGRFVDTVGRKAGTLAFAGLYTLGAISTTSNILPILLLGRVAGGLGTSLLFSAPEAWLVGEHQRGGFDGKWLGQTFGWAYAVDSLVAITAGQLASVAATKSGPTGPFSLSIGFLMLGSLIACFKWKENTASSVNTSAGNLETKKPTIADAWRVMMKDKKILLVGAVQALFEGAMYIFVLQWPPALKRVIESAAWSIDSTVPFGKVFSCFMASCLLGSSAFGALQSRGWRVEKSTSLMLTAATVMMGIATTLGSTSLAALIASFFVFEACVGMYFPSIGMLRSKYIPDSHKSVIVNIFGIPLNLIVVSVFLSIKNLGVSGALGIATGALGIAGASMALLERLSESQEKSANLTVGAAAAVA